MSKSPMLHLHTKNFNTHLLQSGAVAHKEAAGIKAGLNCIAQAVAIAT